MLFRSIVLDPFMGSGTTAQVALSLERNYLGCELNENYKKLQEERISKSKVETSQFSMDLMFQKDKEHLEKLHNWEGVE